MRNLKRALSLALASVMLLGMMVVGTSAASYTDVSSEDNVEAIEVLNAVKVMIGKQGNFDPNAPVNRHEMATILAKLYLGSKEADSYVGSHPFTDVYPWADKYVAACYENDLISGTSKTTFGGNQPLTAVQAALMMLRALGYEDLTKGAADWRAPVAAKANQIRLFSGVVSNPSAQLTRNDVAQLALNALKADVVETEKGADVTIGDVAISTSIKYNRVEITGETTAKNYSDDDTGLGYQQLCEKLYDQDLKLKGDADDLGRPASTWSYKGVGDIITIANEADYTVVLKEAPKNLTALCDLAKKNMDQKSGFDETTDIILNGAAISTGVNDDLGTGDIAEFHMNDDNELDAIYVTRYALDKITAVDDDVDDDDADEGVSCYVDFEDAGSAVNNTDIPGFNSRTYVEDAYVALLLNDDGKIVDSYIPENVEDSVDTVKGDTEVAMGGDKYTAVFDIADLGDCVAVDAVKPGSDNTYSLYLDKNGYVLGIVEVEGEATSIDDVYYLDTVWSNENGMSDTYHAQLIALDGTVSEVQLETKDHAITATPSDDANDLSKTESSEPYEDKDYTDLRGLLVTISDKKGDNGSKANNKKFNLKVWAPDEDWDADQIKNGDMGELKKDSRTATATIEDGASGTSTTYRLNASTVYLFVEKNADDLDVSRYVGGVAYDTTKSNALKGAQSYIITEKDKTVAKYVIIATEDAGQTAEYSSDVIFIKDESSTKGDGFRSQTVYLPKGREQTWKIAEDEYSLSAPGFFTYAENDDGYYELDDPEAMTVSGNIDWQEDKPEGVLANVTVDSDDALFEGMLTVVDESSNTITDIDVANADFKDLHDKDDEDQYDRTVTSLEALVKAIKDEKAGEATLYLNVSKDGAVTIFVTEISAVADGNTTPTAPTVKIAAADTKGLTLTEATLTAGSANSDVAATGFVDGTTDCVKFTIDNSANANSTATATLSIAGGVASNYTAGAAADIASQAEPTGVTLVLKVSVSGSGYTTTEFTYTVKVTVAA